MGSVQSSYRVRQPAVAGSFYPHRPHELARLVTDLLDAASARPRAAVRGVIAPHAGYLYSGPVAAESFACLRSSVGHFRRAIVIGPSHFVRFDGLAAPSCAAFATPLGRSPVDERSIRSLAADGLVVIDDAPHEPDHAIEVELPFLQTIFGEIPIIPLLFGAIPAPAISAVIARLWAPEAALVISSDLSHYEPHEAARRHNLATASAIEALEEAAIGPRDACGDLAIRGMLIEAARRNLRVERLDMRTSGDTAGGRENVVGYGAWALVE